MPSTPVQSTLHSFASNSWVSFQSMLNRNWRLADAPGSYYTLFGDPCSTDERTKQICANGYNWTWQFDVFQDAINHSVALVNLLQMYPKNCTEKFNSFRNVLMKPKERPSPSDPWWDNVFSASLDAYTCSFPVDNMSSILSQMSCSVSQEGPLNGSLSVGLPLDVAMNQDNPVVRKAFLLGGAMLCDNSRQLTRTIEYSSTEWAVNMLSPYVPFIGPYIKNKPLGYVDWLTFRWPTAADGPDTGGRTSRMFAPVFWGSSTWLSWHLLAQRINDLEEASAFQSPLMQRYMSKLMVTSLFLQIQSIPCPYCVAHFWFYVLHGDSLFNGLYANQSEEVKSKYPTEEEFLFNTYDYRGTQEEQFLYPLTYLLTIYPMRVRKDLTTSNILTDIVLNHLQGNNNSGVNVFVYALHSAPYSSIARSRMCNTLEQTAVVNGNTVGAPSCGIADFLPSPQYCQGNTYRNDSACSTTPSWPFASRWRNLLKNETTYNSVDTKSSELRKKLITNDSPTLRNCLSRPSTCSNEMRDVLIPEITTISKELDQIVHDYALPIYSIQPDSANNFDENYANEIVQQNQFSVLGVLRNEKYGQFSNIFKLLRGEGRRRRRLRS
eukprot:g3292.t1